MRHSQPSASQNHWASSQCPIWCECSFSLTTVLRPCLLSVNWSHLADLSGSRDLCAGSPGLDAGSPAGSAAARARLASDLLLVGITLLGSG